jgi:hypothetical protein
MDDRRETTKDGPGSTDKGPGIIEDGSAGTDDGPATMDEGVAGTDEGLAIMVDGPGTMEGPEITGTTTRTPSPTYC